MAFSQTYMGPPPHHPHLLGPTAQPPTYEEHVMHYNVEPATYHHPYPIYEEFDPEGEILSDYVFTDAQSPSR